jgi:hypothetical protein
VSALLLFVGVLVALGLSLLPAFVSDVIHSVVRRDAE